MKFKLPFSVGGRKEAPQGVVQPSSADLPPPDPDVSVVSFYASQRKLEEPLVRRQLNETWPDDPVRAENVWGRIQIAWGERQEGSKL